MNTYISQFLVDDSRFPMVGGGGKGGERVGGTGGLRGEHVYPMIFFENPTHQS